ncbi:MAG: hypothetical protein R3240_00020 [Gammaproteobacteria bacterium]|nr:hypothetical protein [Gammaproteobacteria bacterium]
MARKNMTREANAFQKKGVCVLSAPVLEADIVADAAGAVYAVLPPRSLITNIIVNVTTVSTTASATVDVAVNGTVVANEVAVTTAGAIVGTIVSGEAYLATGGELTVLPGSTAPAAGDLVADIVVEYIELDKNIGEYTVLLNS